MPGRELGRFPLPVREKDRVRGLQLLDRLEPPHPNPLPNGERERAEFVAWQIK